MKQDIRIPFLPELSGIDFSSARDVRKLTRQRHRHWFGTQDDAWIDEYMDAIELLFDGGHPEYQAMDTAYHDINHTLQATLCLVELIHNRKLSPAKPDIGAADFKRALVAVLFHDIGYLKKASDTQGTGAKYTHIHERRSCSFVATFLSRRGWSVEDIRFVQTLIKATGPLADLGKIDFHSDVERLLAQVVCTAD
ncbi:MAG: hypothetical protein RQ826_10535, partial [Xanthomonadales bacterium]|nr:hypothetical protein [Xanthomonadales bacterium]